MKKKLMVSLVMVLILGMGAMSFADGLKAPIVILSDLTGEDVMDLKDQFNEETTLKDLALTYGVLEAFEEEIKENIETALNALIAAGEMSQEEADDFLESFEERLDNKDLHQSFRDTKRSYLESDENREDFTLPAETLMALMDETPETIKDLLEEKRAVEVAIDYGVFEAFESERKAENISIINALYAQNIITADEQSDFINLVNDHSYLDNQAHGIIFEKVKDWLKENTERPFEKYREIFKNPIEIYSELTGESIDGVKAQLEESSLRTLVEENALQDAFINAQISSLESGIDLLLTDGLVTDEEANSWLEILEAGRPYEMREVFKDIRGTFKK